MACEATSNAGQGLDTRVEGGEAERVAAAQAHPYSADTVGVDGRMGGQGTHGVAEIGQLACGVLVLAGLPLAGAEVAVVEGERQIAGGSELFGVAADGHLFLHARERASEDQRRPFVLRSRARRHLQHPGEQQSVTVEVERCLLESRGQSPLDWQAGNGQVRSPASVPAAAKARSVTWTHSPHPDFCDEVARAAATSGSTAVRHGRHLDRDLLPAELPGDDPDAGQRPVLPERGRRPAGRLPGLQRCRPDADPGLASEWDLRADLVGRAMRLIGDGVSTGRA